MPLVRFQSGTPIIILVFEKEKGCHMKNKCISLVIVLFLLTSCTRSFEKGEYSENTYKNNTFGLTITYPEEFKQVDLTSINGIVGCELNSQFTWKEQLQFCKSDDSTNFIWEVVLSNQGGTKLTGVAIKELSSSRVTTNDLIVSLKETELKQQSTSFITSPYKLKIGGLDFEAYTTIQGDESDSNKEIFKMTAVHVSQKRAILITILIKTNDKQDFNQIMKIYTEQMNK